MSIDKPMQANDVSMSGVIERLLFRADDSDFAVALMSVDSGQPNIRLAGDLGDIEVGETVAVMGRVVHDPRFGEQVRVHAIAPKLPHTEVGIRRFLSSGKIEGIGPKLAERLVNHFGAETIEIITQRPHRLAEVSGIGTKRRAEITNRVQEGAWQRETMIFLHGLGLGSGQALKIWKQYREQTITAIKSNPYRLVNEIRGIGFLKADAMALSMGIEPESAMRISAAIVHALRSALDDGHVFLPRLSLLKRLNRLIGSEIDPIPLINLLVDEARLVEEYEGIYLPFAAEIEKELASFFVDAAQISFAQSMTVHPSELSSLSPGQAEAVHSVLNGRVCALTGGPGTGKTTTLKTILKILSARGLKVALAAPTGRAAKRMSESTGATASTIHRLLGYHPVDGFRLNSQSPLEVDVVVVDEASMIDQNLMQALVLALPEKASLLLVGDADQLPSVGPGQILKDVIDSGEIPTACLKEIFRQESGSRIIDVAHSIRTGSVPDLSVSSASSDFYWIEAADPMAALGYIEQMVVDRIPKRFGYESKTDIQVLCPMHKGGCGTENLNLALQNALNPDGVPLRKNPSFRLGDRVIQTSNDHQREVYNGDLGYICHQDRDKVYVEFDGRIVSYMHTEIDQLTLAYAVSIHKSQGSEYPVVIIPVLTEHWVMLGRNLLYTAVTRGKGLVILVGQKKALGQAIRNTESAYRFTSLPRRIWELLS